MRDKHIQISEDSELLKLIYSKVKLELNQNNSQLYLTLLLKFIIYFPIGLFIYCSLYYITNLYLFIFIYILFGFISVLFAFNFSHDFSHNTVFKSKKLNHICFVMIYTLVGAHAEAWKERHVHSHHYAPNVEDYDSDLKISKLIRVIPKSKYYWYHKFQYLYAPIAYTSYSLFWVFIKDFVILFGNNEYNENRNFTYYFSFVIQKLVYILYILVLPLLFSNQSVSIVFIGFICMHLFQSLFLLFTFFMTHHVEKTTYPVTNNDGEINSSWVMNQIKSSNDMHPFSKIANFILGGFNNHIAHHLFPHINHIYYPQLNIILYKLLIKHGIEPNQTSYFGGIVSHLKLLKKMSKPEN